MTENEKLNEALEDFEALCNGKALCVTGEALNMVISAVKKSQEFEAIGAVEEFKALKEKNVAKKPDYEGDGYYNGELVLDTWICPNCGKSYEADYDDYDFCPNCGQHIDHSGLTEDD